jgi:hypothetical protein
VAHRGDDAYAFAVLLYELLTGRLPHDDAGEPGRIVSGWRRRLARSRCPAWPRALLRDRVLAPLADRVGAMLRAGRSVDSGLSAFADVLESVATAGR